MRNFYDNFHYFFYNTHYSQKLFKGGGFLFPTNGIFDPYMPKFIFILEEPILNIFNREKKLEKADDRYVTN